MESSLTSFVNMSTSTLSTVRWDFNSTGHSPSETDVDWWIIITYINLFLYILSVIGNGVVITAFAKDVQMRTTTNMLVVSHLLAEIAASSVGIVSHLTTLVTDEEPLVTSTWCVAGASVVKVCLGGGLLSLVGISVDRYLAVVKKVHHKVTRVRVQVFLIIIWTFSIVYGIPWHSIFHSRIKWNYVAWLIINCRVKAIGTGEDSTDRTAVDVFQFFLLFIAIGIPFFTMAFTSYRILRTALKTRRRVGIIGISVNHIAAAYIKSSFTTILVISIYFLCFIPIMVLGAKCRNRYWKCNAKGLFIFAKFTFCFRSACFPVIFAVRSRYFSRFIRQFFFKRVGIFRKYLISDRIRGSNKENLYHCSSSRMNIGGSATHTIGDTTNLGKCTFDNSRKLAFVDLEKHSL